MGEGRPVVEGRFFEGFAWGMGLTAFLSILVAAMVWVAS